VASSFASSSKAAAGTAARAKTNPPAAINAFMKNLHQIALRIA
jgi:hypothetical protein